MKCVKKIQEHGLRFVFNDYSSSYEALLSRAGLSTLEIGRIRNIAVEIYKAINGYSPSYICSLIETRNSNYSLHEPLNVQLPKPNSTKFAKKSFIYFGSHLWNNLPHDINQSQDLKTFKTLIYN